MQKDRVHYVPKLFTPRGERRDLFRASPRTGDAAACWRWGDDNLFPLALAEMFRRSVTHRRIVNDKADYIAGKGFSFGEGLPRLAAFVAHANRDGETLRQVFRKLAFDKMLFGEETMNRDLMRWLYTAITRASRQVYLVNVDERFFDKK